MYLLTVLSVCTIMTFQGQAVVAMEETLRTQTGPLHL